MVNRILFSLFLVVSTSACAQNYIQQGLLVGDLTYSPSMMLNREVNNYYLTGSLEYFLEKKVSLKGTTHLFLSTESDNFELKNRVISNFGIAYHFNKGNWNNFIGFYPGITVMQPNFLSPQGEEYNWILSPSFAGEIGTRYFVWDYFNFFAKLNYVHSKLLGTSRGALPMDEILLSAGLGFQIPTRTIK